MPETQKGQETQDSPWSRSCGNVLVNWCAVQCCIVGWAPESAAAAVGGSTVEDVAVRGKHGMME